MSKSDKRINLPRWTRLLPALGLIALWTASSAALVFDAPVYLRAFSPNDDGVKDVCPIVVAADGEVAPVDSLILGIYAGTDHDPGDLRASPLPDSEEISDNIRRAYYTWHGRGGDDSEAQPVLPDGFYYLHARAVVDGQEYWLDPPIQLELNTVAPDLDAVAQEPSLYFTPLQTGADSLLQVFFSSATFDTLTDTASATVWRQDLTEGSYVEVGYVERDPHYALPQGGLVRYRLLWDGMDNEGSIVDGRYRLDLTLEDDAGNSPATAMLQCNLDVLAPSVAVTEFGGEVESGLSFAFNPDSLPDSVVVRVRDRNGIAGCVAALDSPVDFDQPGQLLPESVFGEHFYSFDLPAVWVSEADSITLRHLYLEAQDLAGNRKTDLGAAVDISVTLDGEPPPIPVFDPTPERVIQPVITLAGSCDEAGIDVNFYEDGLLRHDVPVDLQGRFSLPVVLSEGTHLWTVRSRDDAGNLSAPSTALSISYVPGPALNIPGRFRGAASENIQINTSAPASAVQLRFYSLDGELLRLLDAQGGPSQFSAHWDLTDAGGRQVMDGLFILNVETRYLDGSRDHVRKVVAVVRAAP